MTGAESEPVEHLQAAAREMIGAARAMLDAAEKLVDHPDTVGQLAGVMTSFLKAATSVVVPPSADDPESVEPDDAGDQIERIDVS